MTVAQVVLLVLYAVGMTVGQALFKTAALSMAGGNASSMPDWLAKLALNPYFLAAALAYLGLSALWVWLLSFIPLSRAYPFVALAFVMTPIAGQFLFSEPVGDTFYPGLVLVVLGLMLVVR